MLQAHSLLWYYFWVAPNLLLLLLAVLLRRRHLHERYPVFLIFALVTGIDQLTLYVADVLPSVSPTAWWYMFWASLLVEGVIKFALIGEIFNDLVGLYPALAKLGRLLISGVGVALVFLATVAAAYTQKNNTHSLVSGVHVLEQTIYMIECGLIVFLFVFAAYFRLRWNRSPSFGIALGLGISACVHLATWAMSANGEVSASYHDLLDFANMATYHACVLIWIYYLLVPQSSSHTPPLPPAGNTLELWNRELERLLHK
jgi:hypothetical protein